MLKVNVQSPSGIHRQVEVEVPKERVIDQLDKAYKKIQRVAELPGFRVGKVPRPLLEKHFQRQAREETLRNILAECVQEAMGEAKLEAVTTPQVTEIDFKEDGSLHFTAQVDIRPEVKLKGYKGIKLTQTPLEVTEEDVEKALKSLQEQHAEYQLVQDRSAKEGDCLVAQLEMIQEGKTLQKQERVWISLDSAKDPEGIVSQLVGMSVGESRSVTAKVAEARGAIYNVKVMEIKEKHLPGLDDVFAKTVSFETLGLLEKDIEEKLKKDKERQSSQALETELLDHLVAEAKLELPEAFVKSQIEKLVRDAKRRLLVQGFQPAQIDAQEETIRERVTPTAERSVKLYFILEEIARLEKIEVQEEEAQGRIKQIAQRIQRPIEEVDRYFESKGLYEDLIEEIKHEKTIAYLLKEAKLKCGQNGG